jgi:hypothetical protein
MYNRRMTEPADSVRYHRLQLRLGIARLMLTATFFLAVLASAWAIDWPTPPAA